MNFVNKIFHGKKKKYLLASLFLLLLSLSFFPHQVIRAAQRAYNKWIILTMILEKVERFYVVEKDPDELLENAIRGLLSSLDEHSVYLTAEEYKEWKSRYEGYHGIGLKYNVIDDELVVVSLVEDGPSAQAGIHIGDRIIEIEGQKVAGLETEVIHNLLSGPLHSQVKLVVRRNGFEEPLVFYVERQQIIETSVPCAFMLDDTTGYLKIARFTESTPTELDVAFAHLRGRGMQQLVLDLRDNGGGEFSAGVAVADRFIPGGKLIVFTKGRAPHATEQYMATDSKSLPLIPVIVLVNERTASDAEIVAGAIQDWDRGLIVGTRTFGKALVQTEFTFQDGSALLLTTAEYFTPLGRSIQKKKKDSRKPTEGEEQATALKKYRTPKGRIIYGDGGIIPDIKMEFQYEELSDFVKKIYFSKGNYFFKYADQFVAKTPEMPGELDSFLSTFRVSDAMLWELYRQITAAGAKISRSAFRSNSAQIKWAIKREIAGRLWGNQGRYAVDALTDRNIFRCRQYFGEAKKLLSE